jgi:hypothetical protein
MRRRGVLAACLGGLVGTAGCPSLEPSPDGAGDGADDDDTTLTPAPVGSADGRGVTTATPAPCPELPTNAEVYVCSTDAADGLHLRLTGGSGRTVLRLDNPTTLTFNTGPDWWTLSRRLQGTAMDDWRIAAQGDGTGRLRLARDESFAWVFGPPRSETDTRETRVGDRPATGRYAFSVVGYFGGGELTAVIAPFTVDNG